MCIRDSFSAGLDRDQYKGLQDGQCNKPHQQCADPEGSKTETYKTAMKSVIKSSPFERAMKVEAELNKLHGRIIKQLDSIKAYELEDRRLQLAEKQLELNKQKLTGEFEIDPDGSTENLSLIHISVKGKIMLYEKDGKIYLVNSRQETTGGMDHE